MKPQTIRIQFLEDGNKVVIHAKDISKSQLALLKLFSSVLHLVAVVPPAAVEDNSITFKISIDEQ